MRRIKSFIISWDFGAALLVGTALYFMLPEYLNMNFLLSVYYILITVLTIIFPLFFAAFAILISSSDTDFIRFLEENNLYTELLWSFKVTLNMLLISLIYSIILYARTSYSIELHKPAIWGQHNLFFIALASLFTYSMVSTFLCIYDTLEFSKARAKFIDQMNQNT